MRETNNEGNDYYHKVLSLFSDFESGISKSALQLKYGKEFLEDFSSIERLFAYVHIPSCPNCSSCPLDHCCLTKSNFNNAVVIAQHMKERGAIEQIKLDGIVYGS